MRIYIPPYMGGLKSNLSCFKQKNLFRFDETLYNIFGQSQKEKDLIDKTIRPLVDNIFDKDRAAIYDYASSLSYDLNTYLRTASSNFRRYNANFYNSLKDELSSALDKLPDTKTTSYRQIVFGGKNDYFSGTRKDFLSFTNQYQKGFIIKHPDFLSSSLIESRYVPEGPYRGLFIIHGKTGKSLEQFVGGYKYEREILHKPNTPFLVTDSEFVNDNLFAAILEEI